MNALGKKLLPGAGKAGEHHRGIPLSSIECQLLTAFHGFVVTDDLVEGVVLGLISRICFGTGLHMKKVLLELNVSVNGSL